MSEKRRDIIKKISDKPKMKNKGGTTKKNMNLLIGVVFACTLLFSQISCTSDINTSDSEKSISFAKEVAPIIFENCTPCHRPGEAGPFPLLTYNDFKKNANRIKFAVSTNYMPPWPADVDYTHFLGERVLSKEQKEIILKFIDKKLPCTDTGVMVVPKFFKGSFFGKPDLIVKMQEPVQIKGDGSDNFLVIKMPYELKKDTFVKLIEFVPGRRKLIHHVNGHTISYAEGAKKNVFSGKNIASDFLDISSSAIKEMNLENDDGSYPRLTPGTIYYLPGYQPPVYPEGIGGNFLKKKGVFLLKNIHYGPSSSSVTDSSYLNIFFSPVPPKRPTQEIQLGTFGLSPIEPGFTIPANQVKTFHTHWKTPQDLSLISVNPHMHLLGKKFISYALTPDGDTIPIIRINKWDFRWQYYYTFKQMIKIPAGSEIHAYATYDNTNNNLNNPFSPPRTFFERKDKESMRTTEEMFQLILTVLPYRVGDEKIKLGN